jgi:hypothetical protein
MMIRSVEGLKDMGIKAFQNMQPADVAKMTKEFSGFISGIDEWQLAAMTFKDNESFQGMTERVASMDGAGRVGAIKQMMDEYGLTGRENSSNLGMLLGAKSPSEALRIGSVAQNAASGGMNDSQYNMLMADSIQKQLESRKTAGEAIAFGEDPTAFIMDRIQTIMKSILHIESIAEKISNPLGLGSSSSSTPATVGAGAKGSAASAGYGRSAVDAKRAGLSISGIN